MAVSRPPISVTICYKITGTAHIKHKHNSDHLSEVQKGDNLISLLEFNDCANIQVIDQYYKTGTQHILSNAFLHIFKSPLSLTV